MTDEATQLATEIVACIQGGRCAKCDKPLGDDVHVSRDANGLIRQLRCSECCHETVQP